MNQETIRRPKPTEIEEIIKIWLKGNIQAHPFIQPDYWLKHMGYMREVLPQSEVYVYEQDGNIVGFIGLQEHYIGISLKAVYKPPPPQMTFSSDKVKDSP